MDLGWFTGAQVVTFGDPVQEMYGQRKESESRTSTEMRSTQDGVQEGPKPHTTGVSDCQSRRSTNHHPPLPHLNPFTTAWSKSKGLTSSSTFSPKVVLDRRSIFGFFYYPERDGETSTESESQRQGKGRFKVNILY